MLTLFRSVTNTLGSSGPLNATQLSDLQKIVANPGVLGTVNYAEDLANKVVNFDPADQHFQNQALEFQGLQVGTTATTLGNLTSKWFLGADHPLLDNSAYSYHVASGTLFGSSNSFGYQDVRQGMVGDCWLIASLEETSIQNPGAIRNMFIDNGDGTFTVRFFHNGVADYVTVDKSLPTDAAGHFVYANMGGNYADASNKLWVALAEKAYAQLDESGWTGRPTLQQTNSYYGLNSGNTTLALSQINGVPSSWGGLISSLTTKLEADFHAGFLVTFNTGATTVKGVVESHSYALVSYFDNGVFILANPWGYNATVDGQDGGILVLNINQMISDGFINYAELNPHAITIVGATQVSNIGAVASANPGHFQVSADVPTFVTTNSSFTPEGTRLLNTTTSFTSLFEALAHENSVAKDSVWTMEM